jgi:hypothetical protein
MTESIFSYFQSPELLVVLLLAVWLIVATCAPLFGDRILGAVEKLVVRCAARKQLAIVGVALLPIVLRISLLWLMPVPAPAIQDEFSYLLAGDTFAHGRLANPTHPMWIFLDTGHVNQYPTYMSKYPPAQGAVLALGQVLGHPWIGVLLSVGAMSGAILWMLQGWFPPRWALLGAMMVVLRLGIFSYWINSYWGGAVAATGGALLLGALPRIFRRQNTADALIMGLGLAILANSRPLEGAILFLPVACVLTVWVFSKRSPSWRVSLPRIILPLAASGLITLFFLGYYNWRLTGNALLFPSRANDLQYSSVPTFVWQKIRPALHYANPQFEYMYNLWERQYWLRHTFDGTLRFLGHMGFVTAKIVYFFLWPELCVPLLALPWLVRDRKMRFLMGVFLLNFLGLFLVVWSQPHYAAPILAILMALLVQAMRHLRCWKLSGRPVGIGLSRAIVLFAVGMLFVYSAEALKNPYSASFVAPAGVWAKSGIQSRTAIEKHLDALPGNNLIIVRYLPDLNAGGEWVNNRADIDNAKVVWAREIPGMSLQPLLDYFRGRRVWLLEPDEVHPHMTIYPTPQPQ